MPSDKLNITLIQPDIVWEDKEANLQQYENYIKEIKEQRQVVVLPEMFSTGFSMAPERLAESMDGATIQWMKATAARYRCILTGSIIIEDDGKYFNRLIWMQPNGATGFYDKRHLFGYAHEDEHYTAGNKRLIVSVNGWRICPLICYDLRFPAWSRNSPELAMSVETLPGAGEKPAPFSAAAYDVLVYVANWPERRSLAWKTLLQARAIENQAYVVGVNRIGTDGKDISYSGDSAVYGPLGEALWQQSTEPVVHTITLEKPPLEQLRQDLPFLKDADQFVIL